MERIEKPFVFFFEREEMLESQYQTNLIKKIKSLLPGCEVIKMDTIYRQGFPDLLILWYDMWAILEVKASASASVQPNQNYYIDHLGKMSFTSYIYPENEREVLGALQQAFESSRRTRISES